MDEKVNLCKKEFEMRKSLPLLGLAAILGISQGAFGAFVTCNKSHEQIWLSHAYYDTDNTWTSEGWWTLNPGECRTIYGAGLSNTRHYLYAEGAAGKTWTGPYSFCTDNSNAFKFYNADNTGDCSSKPYFCVWTPDKTTGIMPETFTFTFSPNTAVDDPRC
jgi:uncharacterized membrane protein